MDRLPPVPPDPGPPGFPALPEDPAPPSRRRGTLAAAVAAIVIGAIGATLIVRAAVLEKTGAKLDPGWRRISVESDRFSVGMPPGWKSVSTTSADRAYEALKSANPELADLVKDQLSGSLSSLIKLLAFDTKSPTLQQKFATNMNVVVAPAAGVELGTFLEQNLNELRKTPSLVNIASRRVELPAGPGGLVTSQLTVNAPGGAQPVAITQYLLVSGTRGYIMSFSTLPSFVSTYSNQFRRIAETFRFL